MPKLTSKLKIELPLQLATVEQIRAMLAELSLSGQKNVRTEELKELLKANELKDLKPAEVSQLQVSLQDILTKYQVVKFTTAIELTEADRQKIISWFDKTYGKPLLYSFRTNSAVLGGVMIQTPKRVHDWSLKAGLEDGKQLLMSKVAA